MKRFENAFNNLERPFAWVDLNTVDRNITILSLQSKDKKIRIATKSIRSLEMLRYLEENIPYFNGWMTFTAAETCYLASQGLDNFLLGYPVMEKQAVIDCCQFIKKGKTIIFMIDDLRQAGWLNDMAKMQDIQLSICLDINLSMPTPFLYFGTRRSSITNTEELLLLIEQCEAMSHVHITGLMGYEAQIAGVGNKPKNFYKGMIIRNLQKRSKKKISEFRKKSVQLMASKIGKLNFVNGGGTGSLDFTAMSDEVTEVTIGSGIFKPALFDYYADSQLQEAAGFALRVTRQPTADTIVCHGGGYLASGPADYLRLPFILSPGLSYYATEGAGEVQTPLKMSSGQYEIGDTIYFRHAKAGELCERFDALHLMRNGKYKGCYKTYRGDGQCFL
ncbi:alanine racemase [Kurthia sibirica]|uniref:Alanine racemase N-terminal domain-containing protein n=1 Tax=Kurthia sibirica TaxID=202750 RepID=A0A2U3ALM0_9BACL|nr:alanine racemase [Kurthia sibirica]PWI25407.1 hypothetical protein DEX24_08700 [Kurthia sibirica]GEK34358.1 amino acid aldolase [Kurthia sibirica]